MTKWEYYVMTYDRFLNPTVLNGFGAQGWELVGVTGTALFFKRLKRDDDKEADQIGPGAVRAG